MPVFVIVSLITSTVAFGLFFNLDIRLYRETDNSLAISLGTPEAIAQDTASTTVTVLNAAPQITVAAAESPVSTSSSPVNEGEAINFTITATDPENNDYHLIVCAPAGATATNNGHPTCTGVEFCNSATTTAGNQATCTYSNVQDLGGGEIEE